MFHGFVAEIVVKSFDKGLGRDQLKLAFENFLFCFCFCSDLESEILHHSCFS